MPLRFNLKKMLDDCEARTGIHVSYAQLAQELAISTDTIKSLATRTDYNPSLVLISDIGDFLGLDPRSYFEWDESVTSYAIFRIFEVEELKLNVLQFEVLVVLNCHVASRCKGAKRVTTNLQPHYFFLATFLAGFLVDFVVLVALPFLLVLLNSLRTASYVLVVFVFFM